MKIPFDIKYRPQIESGEYKVEDGFGREVRIVCWDAIIDSLEENIYGLAGLVKGKSGYENVALYQQDGTCFTEQDRWNLFLITPEPEL